jgi:putative ABC transport system permease protein
MAAPPQLAERLLAATVRDEHWRDSILGDLREEFATMRKRHGDGPAARWYWRQAFAIGARRVAARVRLRSSFPALVQTAELETSGGWRIGFTRDLRHAWRTVARRPGTSAAIVITLALALATNSASFAILDALVIRPFRFPGVERLVLVASDDSQNDLFDRESVSPGDFADWRRESRTISSLAAAEWWDANLSGIDTPEQVAGYMVTENFFPAFGLSPVLGRNFVAAETQPGNHRRAILGHTLWTRVFAADPTIIGRTVRLDGEPYEVVGVAPAGFALPDGAQVWSPLAYTNEEWANRRGGFLTVVGRLADGATIEHAQAEFAAISERLKRAYPETNATRPTAVVTFTRGMRDPGAGAFLAVMQGATLLLLLIACANIANLLLARGAERSQEFAMRLALGAGRARLTWQLMLEAALLTAAAIVAAIPLSWLLLLLSRRSIPPSVIRFVPGFHYMDISPTVFLATAAFGALATLVFALAPAIQSIQSDVAVTLRQGSRATTAPRQRQWLRNSLATTQVAITVALLFGSGLLLTGADKAVNGAMGFDRDDLLVARLVLPERPYADGEKRRQFINGVLDRLRTIPAVTTASMVSNLPYAGGNTSRPFYPDGLPLELRDVRQADYRRVAPNYFETMRIRLRSGRTLTENDRRGTQEVAVVSQSLAERYWPNSDPLGRQFRIAPDGLNITIVGVVDDVLHDWFQQRRYPTVYRPLGQDAPFSVAFVVRTVGEPTSIASDVRRAVRAEDADQPIIAMGSMEKHIEDRTAGLTFIANGLVVVAAIALGLALLGLYSLMAFMVSRRTQELGVRMALGATRWQVIALTTAQGMRITVVGLVLGGIAAFGLGRVMESVLYGIVASSLWQLAALVLVIGCVALVATYLPASRTAQLDPTVALRAE